MKKLLLVLVMISAVCFGAFSQDNSGNQKDGWSSLSYENIPVLKVMESPKGYVVIYQKNKIGVGSTVVPKDWAKGTPDTPRKLKFRKLESGLTKPFMTIVKQDGTFKRVILTLPMNKSNSVWGSLKQIEEGLDKENLDDVTL